MRTEMRTRRIIIVWVDGDENVFDADTVSGLAAAHEFYEEMTSWNNDEMDVDWEDTEERVEMFWSDKHNCWLEV